MVVAAIQGFARRGLMGRLSASCSQEEPRPAGPSLKRGVRWLLINILERQRRRVAGPRSGNQGAPGPGTAKTRRGCARDIHSRHPFSATGSATIRRRAEVRPAQPRGVPALQKDRGRSANARTPQGQERSLGGQSRGSAPADPGVSRLRLRPWPLSPAPGRVFHSTVWLGEAGDVLGAQGAGCGHKSPCGTSFPLLTRGCSRPAPRPGLHRAPRSPSHSLGSLRLHRESSQELPCSPKRGTDSPIQCHHLPSPRSPGPQAAWASPDPGLGLEISFDANWSLLRTSFNSPLTWVPWCPFDGQETPGEVTSSHSSEVAANTLNKARQGGTNVEPQHPWEPPA
ncbi:uncharacterized protein LOC115941305 [Leptonychotes weddellii]|uniref:Uncharacterized protein LOC115941305 n=1 Tax=Leptonychotes weddellii TaxID=9713 RepID=A0A7F8QVM3_LEPWE|nr:uncharacterized protein LOC115941305 [Leptonychotes weddellii]